MIQNKNSYSQLIIALPFVAGDQQGAGAFNTW